MTERTVHALAAGVLCLSTAGCAPTHTVAPIACVLISSGSTSISFTTTELPCESRSGGGEPRIWFWHSPPYLGKGVKVRTPPSLPIRLEVTNGDSASAVGFVEYELSEVYARDPLMVRGSVTFDLQAGTTRIRGSRPAVFKYGGE